MISSVAATVGASAGLFVGVHENNIYDEEVTYTETHNVDVTECLESSLEVKIRCSDSLVPDFNLSDYVNIDTVNIDLDGTLDVQDAELDEASLNSILRSQLIDGHTQYDPNVKRTSIIGYSTIGALVFGATASILQFGYSLANRDFMNEEKKIL